MTRATPPAAKEGRKMAIFLCRVGSEESDNTVHMRRGEKTIPDPVNSANYPHRLMLRSNFLVREEWNKHGSQPIRKFFLAIQQT